MPRSLANGALICRQFRRIAGLLLQTETHSRRRRAFGAIRRTATRADNRYQRLRRFAADRAIGLHRTEADRCRIALVTLRTGCALRTLRSLCTRLSLRSGNALNALRSLWTSRSLRAGLALRTCRSGIAAAATQHQCNANSKNWNDLLHAPHPVEFVTPRHTASG